MKQEFPTGETLKQVVSPLVWLSSALDNNLLVGEDGLLRPQEIGGATTPVWVVSRRQDRVLRDHSESL